MEETLLTSTDTMHKLKTLITTTMTLLSQTQSSVEVVPIILPIEAQIFQTHNNSSLRGLLVKTVPLLTQLSTISTISTHHLRTITLTETTTPQVLRRLRGTRTVVSSSNQEDSFTMLRRNLQMRQVASRMIEKRLKKEVRMNSMKTTSHRSLSKSEYSMRNSRIWTHQTYLLWTHSLKPSTLDGQSWVASLRSSPR